MFARRVESRSTEARKCRVEAAEIAYLRPHPDHLNNGEEAEYRRASGPSYIANYSKALPHNAVGEVVTSAYRRMLRALASGDPDHFEQIPVGTPAGLNLTNPQAGLAFDLEGPDAQAITIPPAPRIDGPENSAEMGEVYWMALLRDVSFIDYPTHPDVADAAADMSAFSAFRGPRDPATGAVTPATLFRGFTPGDLNGPYLSQFLLLGNADPALGLTPDDGFIRYGTLLIDQRQKTAQPGVDYLKTFPDWLAVQNGDDRRGTDIFDPTRRFIRNLRDLATYVHFDALYEAYLNACLLLLSMRDLSGMPVRFDPGNPYVDSRKQDGFGTFGGPHILSLVTEVATRALKAVWFQKWGVHRRLRPEEFGGRIEVHLNGVPAVVAPGRYPMIDNEILASAALARTQSANSGIALLPQAFPEGAPTHPAYGAGHATVAGACVTILKAWFDETFIIPAPRQANAAGTALVPYAGPALTVGGELNKIAANIALGRNAAGVHWRTDYTESVKLGEEIAIRVLQEQKATYNEDHHFSLTKFDGTAIVI